MATGRLPDPNTAPVTAKGDLYTYSTAPAKLAVGNNGETLVADSSTSTGLRYTPANAVGNPVLNSSMQIWQRGTSTTSTNGNGLFGADRWKVYSGATGRTISRQSTNDTTNLPNIEYCSRLARDNGNTNTSAITYWQNFETVNTRPYSGQTVTLSFYGRKGANYSEASSNLNVIVRTGTGTDQDAFYSGYTGSTDASNTNKVLTTTWQRFTSTFTVASTATEMAIGFTANFSGTAGAADYVEITGVQLDLGSVALPFRTYAATLAGELAACQRYFARIGGTIPYYHFSNGYNCATTKMQTVVTLPVPQRVATAISFTTASNYSALTGNESLVAATAISAQELSSTTFRVTVTTAGSLTAGQGSMLMANATTNAYIDASAEL